MAAEQQQQQPRILVAEVWSPLHNVADMAYFMEGAWFVFIGDVETTTEILEPRNGQKEKQEKRITTSVVIMTDGASLSKIRRVFRVNTLRVFVPHKDAGFTNAMFIQMGCLSEYVGDKLILAKEAKKDTRKEITSLKEDFTVSLRSKLEVMVKNQFFTNENFDVSVIIKQRGKDLSIFAFINFFDVSDYTMGLASMVLAQKYWEMLPQKVYIVPRFNREKRNLSAGGAGGSVGSE